MELERKWFRPEICGSGKATGTVVSIHAILKEFMTLRINPTRARTE